VIVKVFAINEYDFKAIAAKRRVSILEANCAEKESFV